MFALDLEVGHLVSTFANWTAITMVHVLSVTFMSFTSLYHLGPSSVPGSTALDLLGLPLIIGVFFTYR